MNNAAFSRLLATNDKALITELTKAPAKKNNRDRGKGKDKGKGGKKGKGGEDDDDDERPRKKGKGKGGAIGFEEAKPTAPSYRDRAKERKDGNDEYAHVAAEFEHQAEVTLADSKYLGGDMDHTHLVKGLDYALLTKVRTELNKQTKKDEVHEERKKKQQKKKTFDSLLAKQVWHTVVDTLHPHHTTFAKRLQSMGKAISLGQRIRGATSVFLPGRMCFEFDTGIEQGHQDIPRMVYMSKEDAPKIDNSKRVASMLPETVVQVRDAFQKAVEKRKQQKQQQRDKTSGVAEGSYAVAQKISTISATKNHTARDEETDIFGNVGTYDDAKAKMLREAKEKAARSSKAKPERSAYFDDAGAEKYKKAPEGQIELNDMVVEEKEGELGTMADDEKPAFEAAERFQGPRTGWVFKLGLQGLGYYREREVITSAEALAARTDGRKSLRSAKRAARTEEPKDDDAYGECFPDSSLGQARMTTLDEDSDEEDGKKKQKPEKEGKEGMDISYGQKQKGVAIDPKKKKMSEAQQWHKIDHMIKNNKTKSAEELQAMRPSRKDPPLPRELTATPAYF